MLEVCRLQGFICRKARGAGPRNQPGQRGELSHTYAQCEWQTSSLHQAPGPKQDLAMYNSGFQKVEASHTNKYIKGYF